ncbi:unnamed protein product [Parajaminaea phylloscopi]
MTTTLTHPPAARTKNPSEAFELYELSAQKTANGAGNRTPPSATATGDLQQDDSQGSSPSILSSRSKGPRPHYSRQTTSETLPSSLIDQTPGQFPSARSSTALLPRFPSHMFASESGKPYRPALITFRGRTLVGDAGFKLTNLAFGMFLMGWADASNGAQLPYIQASFDLEYLEVATMFVANFVGWVLSAGINPYLTDRLGLGKTLIIGSAIQTCACIILSAAPPFAVLDLAFVLIGLGIGIVNASTTAWTANQSKPHLKLGFVLASYGLGALCAPLVVGLMSKAGIKWNRFYLASLGLTVINGSLLLASFRLESEESWIRRKKAHQQQRNEVKETTRGASIEGVARLSQGQNVDDASSAHPGSDAPEQEDRSDARLTTTAKHSLSHRRPSATPGPKDESWRKLTTSSRHTAAAVTTFDGDEEIRIESAPPTRPSSPVEPATLQPSHSAANEPQYATTGAKFRALRKMKVVWIFSVFAFANTGTEVSIGGWTSSYLRERGSGEDAEWIVSAFWAGLMLGRIVLIPVSGWIGQQRAIFVYLGSWLALEVVVWASPNLISKAVATSLSGLALGPCFPILAELATQVIRPRALHTPALGLMGTAAQSGSAFFPFLVGLLAQAKGVKVLPPFVVACLLLQLCIWMLLGWPRKQAHPVSQD